MQRLRNTTSDLPPGAGTWLAVGGVILAIAIAFGATRLLAAGPETAGAGEITAASSGCALADVSGSTRDARKVYAAEFSRLARKVGNEGTGRMCLIVAAGDPLAESRVMWANVGPSDEHRDSPDFAPAEIDTNVKVATRDVERLLTDPSLGENGSALIEATVVAARVLKPGDWLTFLSDGLQNSRALRLDRADLSDGGIARLLSTLQSAGLIADLTGVNVEMPVLLYHPGGLKISDERALGIERFWSAWAQRVGAHLTVKTGAS